MDNWTFRWSHGEGRVHTLGGMLGPVWFNLSDDHRVQPFALFPWAKEPLPQNEQPLTGLMAGAGGEWPCVPFGTASGQDGQLWQPPIHGESAHKEWMRIDDGQDPSRVTLCYRCGEEGPVDLLIREVAGVPGEAAIRCTLKVYVRQPCSLPIGLHPILRMPLAPRSMSLLPGQFRFSMSYPSEVEPERDVLAPGQIFTELSSAPLRGGGITDLTSYPLREKTESLVQLCGTEGNISILNFEEGYRLNMNWPPERLPSCLLWISNGGRLAWPWSGRHFALGIEPVCAAFDLGTAASNEKNPISEMGIPTVLNFYPEKPESIEYQISVEEFKAHSGD